MNNSSSEKQHYSEAQIFHSREPGEEDHFVQNNTDRKSKIKNLNDSYKACPKWIPNVSPCNSVTAEGNQFLKKSE